MTKNLSISSLFDFYGDILSEKQRDAIESYYNDDLTLSEVAQNQGITKQGARDIIKRAENQLIVMEEKLNLFHKFKEMTNSLELIVSASMKIQELEPENEQIQDLLSIIINNAKILLEK